MTSAAGRTGPGPITTVAIEQSFPRDQRIIDDDLAFSILPFGLRAGVWMMRSSPVRDWLVRVAERTSPGIWSCVLCRKRYLDEKLVESAGRWRSVVNLGAGFDTRAFRLPALAGVPVWELDQPDNLAAKRSGLRRRFGEVPSHVQLVPIDFDRDDLGAVLSAHGYPADGPTFFICEAVTQYLTGAGVRSTFGFLAHAARGSRLAFTYIRQDFLDGRARYGLERLYQTYVVGGIWRFGLHPEGVADFLGAYGWRVVEHLGGEELAGRYVPPTGRALAATPVERIVLAERA